jgi:RNA polymerase sigma-70 factor (ECF subfamily)
MESMGLGAEFESVLQAARVGASWALTSLYRELHPALLRYLRVQDPTHYEDIASEVWVAAASGLGRFEGGEHDLRKWLFTIARRRLIDLRRRERRERERMPSLSLLTPPVGNSEEEAMEGLATEAALAAVASLPEDQCEVVLLRVLGGLEVREVAALLHKSKGAVRVLQHRALRRLASVFSLRPVTARTSPTMYSTE